MTFIETVQLERIKDLEAENARLRAELEAAKKVDEAEILYCVRIVPDVWCWWSLAPSEEDSWRFFANGCVDPDPITRANADGFVCLPVHVRPVAAPLSPGKQAVVDAAIEKVGEIEKQTPFKGDPCNMDEVLEWARNRPMDVITRTLVELIPKKDK